MTFLWPELLMLALLVPMLLAGGYVWLLRRRKKMALRYSHLALVKGALGMRSTWRRHVPPALLLLSLTTLMFATARPTASVTLPTAQQTIILAMDLSGSMQAADIAPNRLSASQTAAKAFAAKLPRNVRVGVVAYADAAQLVQPPTTQRHEVLAAIDRFQLQRGTAIGGGILTSLAAIFPDEGIDASELSVPRSSHRQLRHKSPKGEKKTEAVDPQPVPPGSYLSAVIVLLTDGQNTIGPDPIEAAQMAANHGVKVYTVGFGTKDGEIVGFEGFSVLVRLDEDTLQKIAELTRAEYFHAASGADLDRVYEGLQGKLVMETHDTEVTALFVGAATLLLLLAAGLSLWWFGRIS
ncbi:MAG TPA: VWA domain-containing protein [Albitalea sp.]|jgi:Ca-activated chloride channel family protein|nr:VWA domain-containing protein [Albitalea sp.]